MASHYSAEFLSGGVYKHHEGSSESEPKGSPSWIKALMKAHDVLSFTCACAGCNEIADQGAHLRESLWKEVAPIIGFGGTPVVPMCAHDHGTGPVEIDDTPCIYDKNTPIDWVSPQSISSAQTSKCGACAASTIEDPDGDYYCEGCEHYTSQDGQCITDSCSTCGDDYDDDDYDDDDYDDDDGDNDNSNLEARYRSMQSIGQDIADRYRNR